MCMEKETTGQKIQQDVKMKMPQVTIREMKLEDYDSVRTLWMTIRGFGIRSIDDSREGVSRFLKRNPCTSVVALDGGRFCAGMTEGAAAFTMSASMRITAREGLERRWQSLR